MSNAVQFQLVGRAESGICAEGCCVFGQRVTDMKNRNVVLCGVALGGLVVWCAAWYAPLFAVGAFMQAAGNMARRAVGK